MTWDTNLLVEQRIAASHVGSPGRMFAGPGTGKTLVLTRRILYLIQERNIDPREILALTFTRFAASELRQRVTEALGDQEGPRISTLHSFALKQLMRNSERLHILPQPLRIADDWEERNIIQEDIKRILNLPKINNAQELFHELSADWESDREQIELRVNPAFIGSWRNHRQIFGYTLRSELVYELKRALEQIPDFSFDSRITHLLVDEYQDLNPCDLAVIKVISDKGAELFVAGDDDQSIYGFRKAFPEGIRRFNEIYNNTRDLPLTICKRCDSEILSLGEFVADLDPDRSLKHTVPEDGRDPGEVKILSFPNQFNESQGVATICRKLVDEDHYELGDILILLRSDTNHAFSEILVAALNAQNLAVSFDLTQQNPFNSDIGRIILSVLRLAQNRSDHLAWRTLLQLRSNNIGTSIRNSIYRHALDHTQTYSALLSMISQNPNTLPQHGNRVKLEYDAIWSLIDECYSLIGADYAGEESFTNRLSGVFDIIGVGVDDKSKIVNYLSTFSNFSNIQNISDLLSSIQESSDSIEPMIDKGKINILTMHKAKGLTAKAVFIVASEDQHIPGRQEAEPLLGDERRLLFVSLTRAKHKLFVTYCIERQGRQRMLGRNPGNGARRLTRFLVDAPIHAQNGIAYVETL